MIEIVFDEKERVGQWVAEQTEQGVSWGPFYAMGVQRDGELTSGIVVNNWNGSNATGHFATTKVDRPFFVMLSRFFDYCFNKGSLNRVTGLIPASNQKAIRFSMRCGFELEYVMSAGAPGGEDMVVLVMWRDKCPWLKKG